MSKHKLGPASKKELQGVHPDLVAVVQRAIEITVQDFSVHDGIRTLAEQYVARRKAAGLRAFIDGPHFELPKAHYP